MKCSVVHVKKQQRAKKVEWWGDDGKKTEQGDTAGTNHCESEVGSDIKQQKGAREGLRRWGGGGFGRRPAGSQLSGLTRYAIRGTRQN